MNIVCNCHNIAAKALAQDQKSSLEQLLFCCPTLSHIKVCYKLFPHRILLIGLKVATYDGDTAKEDRQSKKGY